jgi:hypothetical protein
LDVSDFGSTIAKIQQEKPKFVVAALVGGAHMSFFRQWAASGMNKKIPLCSTTFGVGNEHLALSAAEGDGILIAGNYSQENTNPANKDFLAKWAKRFGNTKLVHEIAVSQYQGIMLWAACVKKAGSLAECWNAITKTSIDQLACELAQTIRHRHARSAYHRDRTLRLRQQMLGKAIDPRVVGSGKTREHQSDRGTRRATKFRCVGRLTDRQPLIGHHVMIEFVDLTMPDVNPK